MSDPASVVGMVSALRAVPGSATAFVSSSTYSGTPSARATSASRVSGGTVSPTSFVTISRV